MADITIVFVFSSVLLQVKVSLDSLMDILTSLSDIGDCVARVEHLLKELKALEEKALVSLSLTHTQRQHTHTLPCVRLMKSKPKPFLLHPL